MATDPAPTAEAPHTATATFCATLVDEWVRAGVVLAMVAPGSRSTPLALALAADDRIGVRVFHDERSAAFAALGVGLATRRPAVAICTSGTAATHFHAAVVEADLSGVPLIVCTADRPPELWDVGAPQTVDQTHLFGGSVRHFVEPGVPDSIPARAWRSIGARLVAESMGASGRPGPVHANLSFRDPLVGTPDDLPPGRDDLAPWHTADGPDGAPTPPDIEALLPLLDREGVIVAGSGAGRGAGDDEPVARLARELGWPLLADHRSGLRTIRSIRHADSLLRDAGFADRFRPEVVLRFGEPHTSKVLGQWAASVPTQIVVTRDGAWSDPDRQATRLVRADPAALANELRERSLASRSRRGGQWQAADDLAAAAIDRALSTAAESGAWTEPAVVRSALAAGESLGALVVASSMPVRDLEWFGQARDDVRVYANRGANGIDGTIATAIGIAALGEPTIVVLGDVAFLHDATSLTALAERDLDLTIVVVDNRGGGIFSFLPQRSLVDRERFVELFGTPHSTDLVALAASHGLDAAELEVGPLDDPLDLRPNGVRVRVASCRGHDHNVAVHDELHAAVAEAITDL